MARYDVTYELSEIIKATRIQNHIHSKDVATHIGKSQSFVSKLEKGDIKTIDEAVLTAIFKYIFKNDSDFQNFLNTTLSKILETLELRFSDKEIDEQLWFYNYDTVLRLIPIPEALVDDINERINLTNISIEQLCDRINSNEGIHPEITNTDQYPFNEWQALVENHQVKFSFIKMQVEVSEISNILNKVWTSSNYVTMQAIVYYLSKIETYGTKIDISPNQSDDVMRGTVSYLNSYKFYSLTEKSKLRAKAKTQTEFESLLSSFDKDNISLVNEVIAAFKVFSDIDVSRANDFFNNFVKNLKWDNGFTMRILSISFDKMKDLSFSLKKQVITEIEDIVNKYATLPDEQKNIEIYD